MKTSFDSASAARAFCTSASAILTRGAVAQREIDCGGERYLRVQDRHQQECRGGGEGLQAHRPATAFCAAS